MYTNTGGGSGPVSTGSDGTASIEILAPEDVLGIGTGSDILIVDDSDTNLVAYEAALAPLGRKLVLARSGDEALKELLDADFALVLLDFAMPGISGVETARMVRARPRSKGTPILFISGASPDSDAVLEAFEVGALDFISKPIRPEVLRAKVSVYLRLQERTAQVLEQAAVLRDARRTALRLEKLQEITTALGDTWTPEQVASVVVQSGASAVSASGAGMWLVNNDGSLSLAASHAVPAHYIDAWRSIAADADVPAVNVVRSAQPLWVENEDAYARHAPTVIESARAAGRVHSFAVLPLLDEGRTIGVVSFTFAGSHEFSSDERTFLHAVVHASEQALQRARLHVAEKKARAAAELANKRKDEFLAMLGHELRNPMAAIASAVELIQLRGGGLERETAIMRRQLGQLTHIIDDLVDVSRITRGLITLRREAVSVREAVEQACEMVQPEAARLGHQPTVDVPPDALVDADRNRLVQVIYNLVSNAVKYTPAPGRIEVTARTGRDFVTIEVRDNGRGISQPLLADIFELFVQGERGLDRREGGLGIGLTLVRTLVHLHGGAVEVASDGENKGSVFTVHWPRAS
jgi:signal transduction histidine kinase/CheY-like chemotaxis protein